MNCATCHRPGLFARVIVVILAMLPAACSTAPAAAVASRPLAPVKPIAPADAKHLNAGLAQNYQQLILPNRSLAARVATAAALLDSTDPQMPSVLALAMTPAQSPEVRRAVAQAIATDAHNPPPALRAVLLTHLGDFQPATRPDVAAALSRYMNHRLAQRLLAVGENAQRTAAARATAIQALGYERTRAVAAKLIKLAGASQPSVVQHAALAALATLRGQPLSPDNDATWQKWWHQARRWSARQWREHLVQAMAAQSVRQTTVHQQLVDRLLDAEQTLYRHAAKKNRPTVIIHMLSDALVPIRKLGMDLSLQRLLDDQAFPKPLLEALRRRLTDASPNIRRRAMELLGDLADQPAAAIVAKRLARGQIHPTRCLKAALLLLQRLPQSQAVAPAYRLMSDPRLRADAAGVLAAAADANLLPKKLAKQAAARARLYLQQSKTPPPAMITLLGKVGTDADFKRIADWMRSDNTQVKQAAAQAWADAGRPLTPLAMHADDPVIQPIVLAAAAQRGKSPKALLALAAHPPSSSQATDAWRRALVAMSPRVPGEAVLRAVAVLDEQKAHRQTTIDKMLTAAITMQAKADHGQLDAVAAKLILCRGQHRLSNDDASEALTDFQQLAHIADLPPEISQAGACGQLKAQLALGHVNAAFSLAKKFMARDDPATEQATRPSQTQPAQTQPGGQITLSEKVIAKIFINHARTVAQSDPSQALAQLKRLDSLLGKDAPPSVNQRIARLRHSLAARQAPATQPSHSSPTASTAAPTSQP